MGNRRIAILAAHCFSLVFMPSFLYAEDGSNVDRPTAFLHVLNRELAEYDAIESSDSLRRMRESMGGSSSKVQSEIIKQSSDIVSKPLPGFRPEKLKSIDNSKVVIGKDDRQMVDPVYPFTAIGKLITQKGWCTATLIGNRLILTSAHCLPWNGDALGPAKFVPYYVDGNTPFGASNVKLWYFLEKIETKEDYNSPGAISRDVAIGLLEEPLGKYVGYLGWQTFDDDWLHQAVFGLSGYSGDFYEGERMGVHLGATFRSRRGKDADERLILLHDGDMTPGASGGPIFAQFGDDYRIVAVNSGHLAPNKSLRVPNWSRDATNFAVDGARWHKFVQAARDKYSN